MMVTEVMVVMGPITLSASTCPCTSSLGQVRQKSPGSPAGLFMVSSGLVAEGEMTTVA